MFAVIQTGGKQYIVRAGDTLRVELLETEVGKPIVFDALMVAEEDGSKVMIGKPAVDGAKVDATVLKHDKSKKVMIVKFKPKSRYRRNVGHRQPFTELKIEKITA